MDNSRKKTFDGSDLNTYRHPDSHDLNSQTDVPTSTSNDQVRPIPVQKRPVEIQVQPDRLITKPSKLPITSRKPSISPSKILEKPQKAQTRSSNVQDKGHVATPKTRDIQNSPKTIQATLIEAPNDSRDVETTVRDTQNVPSNAQTKSSILNSQPCTFQTGQSKSDHEQSDVQCNLSDVQAGPSIIQDRFSNVHSRLNALQALPNTPQAVFNEVHVRNSYVEQMPSHARVRSNDAQVVSSDSLVIASDFLTEASNSQVKSSDPQTKISGDNVMPSSVQDLSNEAQVMPSNVHVKPSNVHIKHSNVHISPIGIQAKCLDTDNRHSWVTTKPSGVNTRQNVFQTVPPCLNTQQANVQAEFKDFQAESSEDLARQNDGSLNVQAKAHDVPLDVQVEQNDWSKNVPVNSHHVSYNIQAGLNAETSIDQIQANSGYMNQTVAPSVQSENKSYHIDVQSPVQARRHNIHSDVQSSSGDYNCPPNDVHTTMISNEVRINNDFQTRHSNFQVKPNDTFSRHSDVHVSFSDVPARHSGVQRRYSETHINHSDFLARYSDFQCRLRSLSATSDDPSQRLLYQNYRYHSKMDDMAGTPRRYGSFSSTSHLDSGSSSGPAQISNGLLVSGSVRHVESMTSVSSSQSTSQTGPGTLKRQKSYYTPSMVDELRKRNRLFFVDPITKLRNLHGFPWKLTLQVVKLILITAQIVIFGGQRENTIEYFERSDLTYKHLLLKDWEVTYETLPYPPAAGQYAIYRLDDLFDHMNAVMERYYKIPEWSLASIHLNADKKTGVPYPISLCFRANDFIMFPNGSYIVSASVLHNCTDIHPLVVNGTVIYDVQTFLKQHNFTLPFNRTLDITLSLYVQTFHLNLIETHYGPTCYNVSISIVYTNSERSGQMLIDLDSIAIEIDCEGKIMSEEAASQQESMTAKLITFDAAVMAICVFSTLLCSRSLHRCNKLRQDTAQFFRLHKGKPFSFSTHMEYINMWYLLICCNDVLTVVGSAFKIELETREFSISSENYEICSILLGLGVFLTYIGILRYLGFFKSYNILILTVKTSFPHVLRFLVCAICLFSGFMLCGWVVFSPYHIKFRGLSTAAECLFSLVNGDDMFVTYSALNDGSSDAIWYFHRAYLYIFIALFIYVVISVFIAVIMENYENLKRYYAEGFPDTEVQKFIKEDGGMPLSEVFRKVNRENKCQSWFFCLFPCLAWLRRKEVSYDQLQDT